jgi:hypothetical protein
VPTARDHAGGRHASGAPGELRRKAARPFPLIYVQRWLS